MVTYIGAEQFDENISKFDIQLCFNILGKAMVKNQRLEYVYYQAFISGRDVSKLEFNELKSLDANSHNNYEFSSQSNKK